ncbi:MAG: chloride channel protein [Ruminococcaceae bacterium]|nr:chloride channel protein [Oscillospiraceae bacterium]
MQHIKDDLKASLEYVKAFLKWVFIALIVGIAGGVVGSVFHIAIDIVTEYRTENTWVIYLFPLGGLLLAYLYRSLKRFGALDTNRILKAVKTESDVPFVIAPLIFVSTVITHLLGGSAGREGAALQLGGSIGYNTGKILRLNKKDLHIVVMTGMSAVFAALFGTPLTAAIFALEVVSVGIKYYSGLVPCVIASIVSSRLALLFGLHPVRFELAQISPFSSAMFVKVMILALLCALVSILFCVAIKKCEHYMDKLIPNSFLRGAIGGVLIIGLTLFSGGYDYNGAGMDIIGDAMSGSARPEAFMIKIIFTAITISAGFKGGEIVPAFFVGSTFGCAAGSLLGLDTGFSAAIGFAAVFCGAVNCPIASIILALEVFGADNILMFALASGISYMMSGRFSLYEEQRIIYSKIEDRFTDEETR